MALPSSGQISIKQIFDEGISGGCYEGGSGYSLGALADAFGIGTNPDAMSEFYGLSCPGATEYTITYDFQTNYEGSPAYAIITKNEVTQLFSYYSGGGTFTANAGDSIYVYVEIDVPTAYLSTEILVDNGQVCYSEDFNYVSCGYPFTVTADAKINIYAYEI